MTSLTWGMWKETIQVNLLTKQKGPHGLGNELRLVGGRDRQGVGEVMCTLQYLKWIATKDLPCSTGDAAQCHVAARMGGVWGRTHPCVCVAESLHCSPETATASLIGCTPIQNKKFRVWKIIKNTCKKTTKNNGVSETWTLQHHRN